MAQPDRPQHPGKFDPSQPAAHPVPAPRRADPAPGGIGGDRPSASPTELLRLQRRYGNRAVRQLIPDAREVPGARHPQPATPPVQRQFDYLAEATLTTSLGTETAQALAGMIEAYNQTPDWRGLAADDLLQAQVEADAKALTAMEQLIKKVHNPIKAMQKDWQANVDPLLKAIAAHLAATQKETEAIARRAESAKPLKERYLKGLVPGKKEQYVALVGDAQDMAEVSTDQLGPVIALYGPFSKDKEAWQREAKLRERESAAMGGPSGWVTALLTKPKKHPQSDKVTQLIGAAKKPEDLSIPTMVAVLDALHPAADNAKEVWEFFARQVDKRAAAEPGSAVQEKVSALQGRAEQLRAEALARLGGGKTWNELAAAIEEWWTAMQKAAQDETFATVFAARRMTVRCIAKGGSAQGGTFKAMVPVGESGTATGQTDMTLDRGRESIGKRTSPATWTGPDSEREVKRKQGLYELSASLLDPSRDIFPQLKFYQAPEAVVFMAAASPSDTQIFAAISALVDADQPRLREMGSRMTRIILAQSTDMGTKYVDTSSGNLGTDVHYGRTGTVIRYAGGKGMAARSHEIEARRTNALQYTSILDDPKKLVNEVVLEYREHVKRTFPLFTEIDHRTKQFHVVDPTTFARTGRYIDNKGVEH